MNRELSITIEEAPPPRPPKAVPPSAPDTLHYPFELIPVGGAARFPRARNTVRAKLYEYLKAPANKGQRFITRPITPSLTRVWRVK